MVLSLSVFTVTDFACGMAIAESGADCDKDGIIDTSDLAAVKLRLAEI